MVAGVDLGGTKIQTVVLRKGEVAGSARVLTPRTGAAGDVIAAIVGTVRTSLEGAGAADGALRAVGIGMPGEIDVEAGAVLLAANVPGFSERVELGPIVSELVDGVDVKVGNDVSVGVLGEFSRGAGRPFRNLLGVWVGTGVGGGLILDGVLHDGRGAGGEVGHMVVEPGGRRCPCGRRGCLEAYAGRLAMERRARTLVKQGRKTALTRGDKLTKKLIDDAVWALGVGRASAQNLLDLEAIVIGGGLGDRLGQPFVDRIVEAMQPHLFAHAPTVLRTELGDLSGAVGAAVLAGG